MCEKVPKQFICLEEFISEKEYKQINELQDLCNINDKTNIKLELDRRVNMDRSSETRLNEINEFFYYVDEVLVAYIQISSLGNNIGEINGLIHPNWRNKGLFSRLLGFAAEECRNRKFTKLVLLSEAQSSYGVDFINIVGRKFAFLEYRMKLVKKVTFQHSGISLRKAEEFDLQEIQRQNILFFYDEYINDSFLQQEQEKQNTYMIELREQVIGKISIDYSDNSAYIFGVVILPNFRRKGYAKVALSKAIDLIKGKNINNIELDVECNNISALNLYKACGFEEKSVLLTKFPEKI